MTNYTSLVEQNSFSRADLVTILEARERPDLLVIQKKAESILLQECGNKVYYRGLVEASNACRSDCFYCGIRKSNREVTRYTLDEAQILDCARLSAEVGYGSMVLQSGERSDKAYIDMLVALLPQIKEQTRSDLLPEGLGITLCIGQQTRDVYERLYEAGAHRYLLRIETTNPDLFAQIHPADQTFESRLECLRTLQNIGYQVGTGVMIGLPGQTMEDLADDILFFEREDIDMIGMGPFIPHASTPMGDQTCPDVAERVRLGLLMIAAARLKLRDVNIAATTALQALDPIGREKGLRFGANIIMPQVTPQDVRRDYQLYPGKPCLEENAQDCRSCLEVRITSAGRVIGYNEWGDSVHARRRRKQSTEGRNNVNTTRERFPRIS